MKLLPSQKTKLYDLIAMSGLSPKDFSLSETHVCKITHAANDFYFQILPHSENYEIYILEYSPAENSFKKLHWAKGWQETEAILQSWINLLKIEILTVDKWAWVENETNSFIPYQDDETKFSTSEVEIIKDKMQKLQFEMRSLPLAPQQLLKLEQKIENLTLMTEKLSKFDWVSLFAGTIAGIIAQYSITPENARAIWNIIKKLFNGLFLS